MNSYDCTCEIIVIGSMTESFNIEVSDTYNGHTKWQMVESGFSTVESALVWLSEIFEEDNVLFRVTKEDLIYAHILWDGDTYTIAQDGRFTRFVEDVRSLRSGM